MKKLFLPLVLSCLFLCGFVASTSAQMYDSVLECTQPNTPTHGIKIKTNIPFDTYLCAPTIIIEKFNFGGNQSVGITLNWYVWGNAPITPNAFIRYTASSFGGYAPPIKLGAENGKVVIFIDAKMDWARLNIRAYSRRIFVSTPEEEHASWFQGWTHVDEDFSTAMSQVDVPYTNNFGDTYTKGTAKVENGLMIGQGIYKELAFKPTEEPLAGYYQTTDVYPTTIPGSGIAKHLTYFRNSDVSSNGGYTQHDISVQGRVGIGTATPQAKLHIFNGNNSYGAILANSTEEAFSLYTKSLDRVPYTETFRLGLKHNDDENNGFISFYRGGSTDGGFLGFSTNGAERMRINKSGAIGIGTESIPTDYKLAVNGKIIAEGVKVALHGSANWPDYVFAPTYQLMPLSEVEQYIAKNKHLPDVPSAEEVAKEGIDVATMDAKLLQKIEELTLYTIEQQKMIEAQQQALELLLEEVKALKKKK